MIGFAGLSHLGIVSSLAAAVTMTKEKVVAYDPDNELCKKLSRGELPVYEPGLAELLKSSAARIEFTSELSRLKDCALITLSPDTPTDAENRGDLTALRSLFESVAAVAPPNSVLVVLSQVRPGFTRGLADALKKSPSFRDQKIYHQVETLIFGDAVQRALKPERFIIGCADPGKPLEGAYLSFLDSFGCPVFQMKYESAELAKMSINACLIAPLSAANTLAEICEKIGADWREIEPALRADRRLGSYAYLSAGLGISGGNIERDLVAIGELAREWGTDPGVMEAFISNSLHRKNWALQMIHRHADQASPAAALAVWGLAYKAGTNSVKNSPAVLLLEKLPGRAVKVYDPQVKLDQKAFPNAVQVGSALEACRGAKLLAIMTPWKEFSSVPVTALKETLDPDALVLDPFGVLDESACFKHKLKVYRLGAAAS